MIKATVVLAFMGFLTALSGAGELPDAEIGNGELRVKLYLPDAKKGFYRGTRFDWSGVIYSLAYKGHQYYGPWFQKTRPEVHDWVYEGPDIVAGPASAITGPVDEFQPLGWDSAKVGGHFVKIGIGALRKPDQAPYDNYRLYEVVDPGKWTVRKTRDAFVFTQELTDASSGYGYVYRKTVRLTKGKPEMVLEHSVKNTGEHPIDTTVYNHNFLVLDGHGPQQGLTITVPFRIESPRPPAKDLAEIRGNRIVYLKTLTDHDVVTAPLRGFGSQAKDHEIRIEDARAGAGMLIRGDRPLVRESLWSIRTVVAMEPFIALVVPPGTEFNWSSTYQHYTVPGK